MNLLSRAFPRVALAAAVLTLGVSSSAFASGINLVQNGSFESTSSAGTSAMLNWSSTNTNQFKVDNWTNNYYNPANYTVGYNFLMTSGTAVASGYGGNISLWNNNTPGGNGGVNTLPASPDGGNFLAMDGAHNAATVSQTITGLTVGNAYQLSFYYAGAQQYSYTGATTEAMQVTFGSDSYTTPILNNVSHGFTGWQAQTTTFIASSTSETLSFLALGTPQGVPPFSLLDGVSLNQVVTPEPNSLMLLGTGILSVGGLLRRRFSR